MNPSDFTSVKLGLLAPTPGKPALRLRDFLTGVVPDTPAERDYLSGLEFGLYANDKYGVCGPCSVANSRRLITARLEGAMVAPSQEEVFDLYRRSGNPNFDPRTGRDDNGVNMQTMLNAVAKGGIGGAKCLAYARVDPSDINEMQAATALFGFLLLGVRLQQAQQGQTKTGVWDYKPSASWGGHAVPAGAYRSEPAEQLDVITWNQRVRMTEAFTRQQASEAWVVIWPEHLQDQGFLEGVDLQELAAAYEGLTGRPFPAVLPRPTPPAPAPARTRTITVTGKILVDGKEV